MRPQTIPVLLGQWMRVPDETNELGGRHEQTIRDSLPRINVRRIQFDRVVCLPRSCLKIHHSRAEVSGTYLGVTVPLDC